MTGSQTITNEPRSTDQPLEPLRPILHTKLAANHLLPETHASTLEGQHDTPSTAASTPQTPATASSPSDDRPFDALIDIACFAPIIETLKAARNHGLPDTALSHAPADSLPSEPLVRRFQFPRASVHESRSLQERLQVKLLNPAYQSRLAERNKLPIMAPEVQQRLLHLLETHDVLVLVSGTGSGKTTQVPQIILDAHLAAGRGAHQNILCTQPRRISATSVARRVSVERMEPLQQSVGFQIRFVDRRPKELGSILYCTTAVLLKRLLNTPDDVLKSYRTIIIDEVHEQSLHTDLVITLLRDLILRQKARRESHPKVILMSATINSNRFAEYFKEHHSERNPLRVVSTTVKGLSYPVEAHYLDDLLPLLRGVYHKEGSIKALLHSNRKGCSTRDYIHTESCFFADPTTEASGAKTNGTTGEACNDLPATLSEADMRMVTPVELVFATIAHIAKTSREGDILVFLSGLSDIEKTSELLQSLRPLDINFNDARKFRVFKLHSSLHETNDVVFSPVPAGCRRIVLATNIAETSITLPGVVHVIDTGKLRKLLYDQGSCRSEFTSNWISKASSMQRRGRAGRVQPGQYYALFSKKRYDGLPDNEIPELLTTDLVAPLLEIKASATDLDIQTFFSKTPNPPDEQRVHAAITSLQSIGALTEDQHVTPLGRLLAKLPIRGRHRL